MLPVEFVGCAAVGADFLSHARMASSYNVRGHMCGLLERLIHGALQEETEGKSALMLNHRGLKANQSVASCYGCSSVFERETQRETSAKGMDGDMELGTAGEVGEKMLGLFHFTSVAHHASLLHCSHRPRRICGMSKQFEVVASVNSPVVIDYSGDGRPQQVGATGLSAPCRCHPQAARSLEECTM